MLDRSFLMTEEERFKITSEDYADFIIVYNRNLRVLENFPGGSVHLMNDRFAIVYLPREELTARSITQYGYDAIPLCFGLTSEQSIEATGIRRLRRLPAFNLRGQGVLIGIIDTGIDYTNPIFIRPDGTTRIRAIWDQTIDTPRYPTPFLYGTQYLAEDINMALRSENPYEVVPSVDEIGHGTMLAGIAAGNEVADSDFSGVAPDAEIIVVKLKQAKETLRDFFVIPPGPPCFMENDIMWAVQYMIMTARNIGKPIAVCCGLGTSLGSHDGRGSLGSMMSVSADFPGVVINVAAGNEGNTRRHFFGEVDQSVGFSTVELNIGENEPGFSMELWGTAPNTYSIDILSPSGEYIPRIVESLRFNRVISFVFEETQLSVDYQMVEATTGDQLILMRFRNPTPGIWRFQVYSRGDLKGIFHIWLPSGDFISRNTYFIQPNEDTTVTSPGTALVPITVTAYNPENNNLFPPSSRGFTRANDIKPELAAPGVNILSPTLDHGFALVSGTSAATAHMTGVTAMLLEWGIVRGFYNNIDTVEVKKFLIRGAKRSPTLTYPNQDWGYGIVDIYNVFNTLRADFESR